MSTRILSFVKDGQHWRIMKVPHGYYHRFVQDSSNWRAGIPASLAQEEIEDSFQQLTPGASLLHPTDLKYKGTYHIGATNTTCIQFVTTAGDLFTIKIPSRTVHALQTETKTRKLPDIRMARLALEYIVEQGIPEIDMELESAVYDLVRARLTKGF